MEIILCTRTKNVFSNMGKENQILCQTDILTNRQRKHISNNVIQILIVLRSLHDPRQYLLWGRLGYSSLGLRFICTIYFQSLYMIHHGVIYGKNGLHIATSSFGMQNLFSNWKPLVDMPGSIKLKFSSISKIVYLFFASKVPVSS